MSTEPVTVAILCMNENFTFFIVRFKKKLYFFRKLQSLCCPFSKNCPSVHINQFERSLNSQWFLSLNSNFLILCCYKILNDFRDTDRWYTRSLWTLFLIFFDTSNSQCRFVNIKYYCTSHCQLLSVTISPNFDLSISTSSNLTSPPGVNFTIRIALNADLSI